MSSITTLSFRSLKIKLLSKTNLEGQKHIEYNKSFVYFCVTDWKTSVLYIYLDSIYLWRPTNYTAFFEEFQVWSDQMVGRDMVGGA